LIVGAFYSLGTGDVDCLGEIFSNDPQHDSFSVKCGSMTVRITANANTPTAKENATTRTRRYSNFSDALAKKSTAANNTVFARY
jgi:hypothetical protein